MTASSTALATSEKPALKQASGVVHPRPNVTDQSCRAVALLLAAAQTLCEVAVGSFRP